MQTLIPQSNKEQLQVFVVSTGKVMDKGHPFLTTFFSPYFNIMKESYDL